MSDKTTLSELRKKYEEFRIIRATARERSLREARKYVELAELELARDVLVAKRSGIPGTHIMREMGIASAPTLYRLVHMAEDWEARTGAVFEEDVKHDVSANAPEFPWIVISDDDGIPSYRFPDGVQLMPRPVGTWQNKILADNFLGLPARQKREWAEKNAGWFKALVEHVGMR